MRRLIKAFNWGFAIIFLIAMLLKWIVTGVYVSKTPPNCALADEAATAPVAIDVTDGDEGMPPPRRGRTAVLPSPHLPHRTRSRRWRRRRRSGLPRRSSGAPP